jgi:hypothetical protein
MSPEKQKNKKTQHKKTTLVLAQKDPSWMSEL